MTPKCGSPFFQDFVKSLDKITYSYEASVTTVFSMLFFSEMIRMLKKKERN